MLVARVLPFILIHVSRPARALAPWVKISSHGTFRLKALCFVPGDRFQGKDIASHLLHMP